jgi:nickel/cobalt exporter
MFPTLWLWIATAFAHPFGSNLYGHKIEVWLEPHRVEVAYLAEVPTPVLLRELKAFLADVESPTMADQDRHTSQMLTELSDGLRLLADGERMSWRRLDVVEASGVGDTRFIAYHLRLEAMLPPDTRTLNLVNGNRPEERALFATDLNVSAGVILDGSSQIDVDEDGHIAVNRAGQWRGEEGERELRVSFRTRGDVGRAVATGFRRITGGEEGEFSDAASAISTAKPEILPSLVKGELTPRAIAISLFLALILGAAHAFSPGHGKALVAAYLLGERRSIRHALMLGGIVTVTHTITVFVLGGVALVLSEVLAPETLLPWMELVSGLLVLGVGAQLIRTRLKGSGGHGHEHSHGDAHAHDDHPQGDAHAHDAHHGAHGHAAAHAEEMAEAGTPGDLIALGISGGIAPCPSALVLLLTAISFHRIAFGLVLVTVFSLGLALVVSALGVIVILLGDRLRDRVERRWFSQIIPVISAVVITVLGAGLTFVGVKAVVGLIVA